MADFAHFNCEIGKYEYIKHRVKKEKISIFLYVKNIKMIYKTKQKGGIDDIRIFFIYVMKKVDTFEDKPKLYNTITTNCLTSLLRDFTVSVHRSIKFDFRLIENGYFDELMYERGVIETGGLSFPELKKQHHINQYVGKDTYKYSEKIRTCFEPAK